MNGTPRGWIIPDQASCIRCRKTGGDHHRCWPDRCPGCRWRARHALTVSA